MSFTLNGSIGIYIFGKFTFIKCFVYESTKRNLDMLEKLSDDLPIRLCTSLDGLPSSHHSPNTSLSSIPLFLSIHIVKPTNYHTQTANNKNVIDVFLFSFGLFLIYVRKLEVFNLSIAHTMSISLWNPLDFKCGVKGFDFHYHIILGRKRDPTR